MNIPYFILDTFTEEEFKGNPTAVCLTEKPLASSLMHSIAKELRFPVTAFVEQVVAVTQYPIRYFTITGEIPACGHATLAAARVIMDSLLEERTQFTTIEGLGIDVLIENDIVYMYYPKYSIEPGDITPGLLQGLGLEKFLAAGFCKELETVFIEIADASQLRKITPDHKWMMKTNPFIKEVVVTSVSDNSRYDFLLRSFCPWIGIDEDPVTGSVHSVLAHYWKDRLGKYDMLAFQASERGGEVYVKALEDRVLIGGKTVVVGRGDLSV